VRIVLLDSSNGGHRCREVELELREELDLQQAKLREVVREKETALEVICDHENTIAKFRTFVNQVGGPKKRETSRPKKIGKYTKGRGRM
jgi:hypothetical protein